MNYFPPYHYVIFDSKSLTDFGVYVSGEGTFSSPEREYETVEILGRSGDLHIDKKRYLNVEITYPSFILEDLRKNMADLRGFLLGKAGYRRLEDTYHPDEYRLADFKGPIDVSDVLWLDAGRFDLTFDCKPQRYLKSGEQPIEITSNRQLFNPTSFVAKPLIRVYGSGELGVGSETVTIAEHEYEYLDIDCDIMDCYYKNDYAYYNLNSLVTFNSQNFPDISVGQCGVSLGDGISKVIIWPRWWRL